MILNFFEVGWHLVRNIRSTIFADVLFLQKKFKREEDVLCGLSLNFKLLVMIIF